MADLFLTGNQDQALLALVVREAASAKGRHVGRTAIQKIMYFLKATGVPMGYRFDIYHYGPYCYEISRDMEWLMADGVIEDKSLKPEYSNYAPGSTLDQLLTPFVDKFDADRVRQVVNTLIALEPDRLELLATLDYLYRQQKAVMPSGAVSKEEVVRRFLDVKKDKFSRDIVEGTYDVMAQVLQQS